MRQKKDGYPYYELAKGKKIEKRFLDFARRRIGGLATFSECHRPLISLLANAYILGMQDAVDAQEYMDEQSRNPAREQSATFIFGAGI